MFLDIDYVNHLLKSNGYKENVLINEYTLRRMKNSDILIFLDKHIYDKFPEKYPKKVPEGTAWTNEIRNNYPKANFISGDNLPFGSLFGVHESDVLGMFLLLFAMQMGNFKDWMPLRYKITGHEWFTEQKPYIGDNDSWEVPRTYGKLRKKFVEELKGEAPKSWIRLKENGIQRLYEYYILQRDYNHALEI